MDNIEQNLSGWRASLMESIPLDGLISRNPVAYKWKAPFHCWLLREAALWRVTDLLTQSLALHQQGHGLGSRILLRSAFETVAVLIYLNQLIQQVLDDQLDFHQFAEKTSVLLLGSRDGSTPYKSLNIVTILEKCEVGYPGIVRLYSALSESAHPNHEGMMSGYSRIDHDEYVTNFSNRWMLMYGDSHRHAVELCMLTFHFEYDQAWTGLMEAFENWIVENDPRLEATKAP
jgi:hypothetical protein